MSINIRSGKAVKRLPDKSFRSMSGDAVSRWLWFLDSEKLCAEARRETGLNNFGDASIEKRLSVLTKSLEHEANLHPFGRFLARMHLRDLLKTRMLLIDFWNRTEALDAEAIERPIFITGMPRSGSTFLHELLVQNADHRAPLVWEVMCPPLDHNGTREHERKIRKAAACLWWFRRIAPRADQVHPMRATTPHECVAIHSYTFLSQEFPTIFHVPSYEAFLDVTDFTPAYTWQKRFLQHLQVRRPTKRWVLKAPDHIFSIPSLFEVFPDAMIIQTHRDPMDVLKSSTQLGHVLRRTFARPEERRQVGRREARVLAEGVERILRFRDSHPELAGRFLDVDYHELVADPAGTVRRCHRALDIPATNEVDERIRSLASRRSRYPTHRHGFTLAEFGIDVRTEARRFENYYARFGIRRAEK